MKQKKKNKSLSYSGKQGKSRSANKKNEEKTPREPFSAFEKLLLVMFGISLLVAAASFFTDLQIITYITIANYLILGIIIMIRPTIILQILRKRTENYNDDYKKKELYLSIALRVVGLFFLGIAYLLLYNLGLVPNVLPF